MKLSQINPDRITKAVADRNYTTIHFVDGKTLVSAWNLGALCKKLGLVKVSRSVAVPGH